MKTVSTQARVCSFLLAVLTSTMVLGGTVAGMLFGGFDPGPPDMAMQTVTPRLSAAA